MHVKISANAFLGIKEAVPDPDVSKGTVLGFPGRCTSQ